MLYTHAGHKARELLAAAGDDACAQTRRRGAPAPLRLLMERASEADVWKLALLQPGVLRLCLYQNRNVGIGVFPEGEKIPVRQLCLDLVPRESECST